MNTETTAVSPSSNAQGEDKIKVDTNALVLLSAKFKAPRPSAVKDPETSKYLHDSKGDAFDAVTHMLRDEKNKAYPEIAKVTTIRNEWNSFLDEHSLQFEFAGMRVISVHHVDKVKAKLAEVDDALSKQAKIIIDKLPEWEQIAKKRGNYIAKKFPTPAYFAKYKIDPLWLTFSDGFDISSALDNIKTNAIDKLKDDVDECIQSLTSYVNKDADTRKRFTDQKVKNLVTTAERLHEAKIISSETFEEFCEKTIEIGNSFNKDAFKEAKRKIDEGVSDEVSEKEIDLCKEYLDVSTSQFEELSKGLEGLV